jgi:hypothetical protein
VAKICMTRALDHLCIGFGPRMEGANLGGTFEGSLARSVGPAGGGACQPQPLGAQHFLPHRG